MGDLKYKSARFYKKNIVGNPIPQNMTITPEMANEEYVKKGISRDATSDPFIFGCPGHDINGKPCIAKLFLKESNIGTFYFSVNNENDHSSDCGFREQNKIREQNNPEFRKAFDLRSFGKVRANGENHNSDGKKMSEDERNRKAGLNKESVLKQLKAHPEDLNLPIYPNTPLVYALHLLLARPEEATSDKKLIEDQILCRRTAEMFYRHLDSYTPGDHFLLLLRTANSDMVSRVKNGDWEKEQVIVLRDRYEESDTPPVFRIYFPYLEQYSIVRKKLTTNLLDKNEQPYKPDNFIVCGIYNGKTSYKFGDKFYPVYQFTVYSSLKFAALPKEVDEIIDIDRDY